ncbi:unnamed protein product [Amaranthus hypochondriacus]
MAPMNLS